MRILQLIDSLNVGGLEKVGVNLANALADEGVYSCLVSTRKEGPLKAAIKPNVRYCCLNKKYALDLKAIYRLKQFLKAHKIDILHAHGSSYFTAILVKLVMPSIKLVWHDHLGARKQQSVFNLCVLKISSLFFNQVLTVNENLKIWSQQELYCKNVLAINNFIPETDESINNIQLPGKKGKRIVCVANLRPVKNHLQLLQAFNLVKEQYPEWTLHLIGSYSNDSYFKEIKSFIAQNHLKDHIFIHGLLPSVTEELLQSQIGVLSSHNEGLPLAILEYGMAGLAVVSTNVGDINNVINHGRTGWLVAPDDFNAMALYLEQLIVDAALRNKMGEDLKSEIRQSYSKQVVLEQLIDIYKRILNV